jgi:hypothetical protein
MKFRKRNCHYSSLFNFTLLLFFTLLLPAHQEFIVNHLDVDCDYESYSCRDFFIDEPIIYVTKDPKLYAYNSSGFQELTTLGIQESPDSVRQFLLKQNDYLFMLRREEPNYDNDFLEIVDVSDSKNPELVGEVLLPSFYDISAYGPESSGLITIEDQCFLLIQEDSEDHFLCINCTIANQPAVLDYYYFPGEAGSFYDYFKRFFVRDNTIFIPTGNTTDYGFVAYNFTTIQSMTKVTEWFGPTNITYFDSIYVSEDRVYLKKLESFIEVISVQNLSTPTRIGYIDLGFSFYTLFREEYLIAFMGNMDYHNLSIFNYSNFTNIEITSTYLHPGEYFGTFNTYVFLESMVTKSYIYVPIKSSSFFDKTLYVFDWSNPYNLTIKATFGLPTASTGRFPFISLNFFFVVFVVIICVTRIKLKKRKKK